MKLNNLIPISYRTKTVRRFGDATLVKLPNGQHELVGGSDADRTAAFEWVSLFAHEIVFTHFHREGPKRNFLRIPRLQPALDCAEDFC